MSGSLMFAGFRCITVVALAALVPAPSPASAHGGADTKTTCRAHHVPVSVPGVEDARLFGELCTPARDEVYVPDTIQILVHGASYGNEYWAMPGASKRQSYVDAAARLGHATFAVDMLGVGESTRPASSHVTLEAGASALHQLIAKLRRGALGARSFSRVVGVGHSLGVAYWWNEAKIAADVDAYVLVGQLHTARAAFFDLFSAGIHPASDDPKFAGLGLDTGYVTTVPGVRADLFNFAPAADPRLVALDEEFKETVTTTELAGSTPQISSPPPASATSQALAAPTLLVVGEHDGVWCGSGGLACTTTDVERAESPYYAGSAALRTLVIRGAGHAMQLERRARATNRRIVTVAARTLGR